MEQAFLMEKDRLMPWLEGLGEQYRLIGPSGEQGLPAFKRITSVHDLLMDYGLTMMGPQTCIYHLSETLCTIRVENGDFHVESPDTAPPQVLLGVHSCDLHALLVLDKVFLKGRVVDHHYRLWRENTVVIGYHCTQVYPQCFCASMGTGPFFEPKKGYDLLLTDLGAVYLMEPLGQRARQILSPLRLSRAGERDFASKEAIDRALHGQFKKTLDTTHLVDTILAGQDHPVWRRTAEERCLGCTNCTMVCPTCFCSNVKDRSRGLDPAHWDRVRYKDSCQELHFAEVHGGNFRSTRTARLRQFVTHKLATWWEQFGCFGCVGCGRCMTWCPTRIDLTDMTKQIMISKGEG